MTYPEAIEFLQGLRMFAAVFGLGNTRRLAALAGDPQNHLRFIHVAGTNGKGSTCAMLEAIYRAAGLRVGLFTSPHLVSFRERIQVNRELIPEADLARMTAALYEKNRGEGVTLFEFTTVLALMWFAEQHCDLVIWETGLGGRLDATNIVTPLASVITNIAFDHEPWLGDTLAKIAGEKAGIIKPGVPVLTAAESPEALEVIAATAQKNGSPLTLVGSTPAPGPEFLPSAFTAPPPPVHRSTETPKHRIPAGEAAPWVLSLMGRHQHINAALALATVEVLQTTIRVAPEHRRAGLAAVYWPGRLQLISQSQPDGTQILLDGAHNAAGAEVLRLTLETEFAGQRPVLIFGSLSDKNWPESCRILAPLAARILTVPVASKRTADARELAAAFRAAHPPAETTACPGLPDALIACKHAGFIVITGSLYLVGEALDLLGLARAGVSERGLNEWSGGTKT
jgi:dihydrofolate synthase/folylpolyglutamate synthase